MYSTLLLPSRGNKRTVNWIAQVEQTLLLKFAEEIECGRRRTDSEVVTVDGKTRNCRVFHNARDPEGLKKSIKFFRMNEGTTDNEEDQEEGKKLSR